MRTSFTVGTRGGVFRRSFFRARNQRRRRKSPSRWQTLDSAKRCHDTQHNDTQHNDIKHNDIQHNDIQHNDTKHNDTQLKGLFVTFSINGTQHKRHFLVSLCWMSFCWVSRFFNWCAECHYAECHYAKCRGAAKKLPGKNLYLVEILNL
jgi:hypothetical protein